MLPEYVKDLDSYVCWAWQQREVVVQRQRRATRLDDMVDDGAQSKLVFIVALLPVIVSINPTKRSCLNAMFSQPSWLCINVLLPVTQQRLKYTICFMELTLFWLGVAIEGIT